MTKEEILERVKKKSKSVLKKNGTIQNEIWSSFELVMYQAQL
jgi:hypothetical protein